MDSNILVQHVPETCFVDMPQITSVLPPVVSITKCTTVIGSPRANLLRNWRAVTWLSNYSYPISNFCNWIAVTGHLGIRSDLEVPEGWLLNSVYRRKL